MRDGNDIDFAKLKNNFVEHWNNLSDEDQQIYRASFELLQDKMPLKNYDISHDEIHLRSRCNIIVESYSSDTSVAFSEKIFRALTLPVPWTVYGGYYSVAYLESLGFDCMSDLIGHNHYDRLKEIEDKVHIFVWKTLEGVREITNTDQSIIAERCSRAAAHNQTLLEKFKSTWDRDFKDWCELYLS